MQEHPPSKHAALTGANSQSQKLALGTKNQITVYLPREITVQYSICVVIPWKATWGSSLRLHMCCITLGRVPHMVTGLLRLLPVQRDHIWWNYQFCCHFKPFTHCLLIFQMIILFSVPAWVVSFYSSRTSHGRFLLWGLQFSSPGLFAICGFPN